MPTNDSVLQFTMLSAQQTQQDNRSAHVSRPPAMPAENLTLEETLRVLDVAREMREERQTAEEMFRRGDARQKLREKLMRSARIAGENVTESELDAAIDQYLATQHTYADPPAGMQSFFAHCWVRRQELFWGICALGATLGGIWYLFA